jgi:hypothetical protein
MRRWKLLIILASGAAALAVGLGSRAKPEDLDLLAFLTNAINAIT